MVENETYREMSFPGGSVDIPSKVMFNVTPKVQEQLLATELIRECKEELGAAIMMLPLITQEELIRDSHIRQFESKYTNHSNNRTFDTIETFYYINLTSKVLKLTNSSSVSVAMNRITNLTNSKLLSRSQKQCEEVHSVQFVPISVLTSPTFKIWKRQLDSAQYLIDSHNTFKIPSIVNYTVYDLQDDFLKLLDLVYGDSVTLEDILNSVDSLHTNIDSYPMIWTITIRIFQQMCLSIDTIVLNGKDAYANEEDLWIPKKLIGHVIRMILQAHPEWADHTINDIA